ncbi:hypothetical protein CPSG_01466 [Coccidioides posadasii str. Silveira]|uniref:Uncharacterized protein n=1 Tax=Coccidioides posadasii (strain RMSCC 757 / Silveira) TaxID=443226 RepID=E9CVI3_COCPS|nr:hypothetical protein CPSG_01466 [Coccidioides posadasii str. Silveira]
MMTLGRMVKYSMALRDAQHRKTEMQMEVNEEFLQKLVVDKCWPSILDLIIHPAWECNQDAIERQNLMITIILYAHLHPIVNTKASPEENDLKTCSCSTHCHSECNKKRAPSDPHELWPNNVCNCAKHEKQAPSCKGVDSSRPEDQTFRYANMFCNSREGGNEDTRTHDIQETDPGKSDYDCHGFGFGYLKRLSG